MVVRLYRVKGRGLKEHRTRTCMKHIERKKERKKETNKQKQMKPLPLIFNFKATEDHIGSSQWDKKSTEYFSRMNNIGPI